MHGPDSVLLLLINFRFSENSQKKPYFIFEMTGSTEQCDLWEAPSVPKTGCDHHLNVNLNLNRFHSG